VYAAPHDGIDNGTCHAPRIRYYDASETDIYEFLLGLASIVDEINQIRRGLPFLGPDISIIQKPVPWIRSVNNKTKGETSADQ
jgi:hypothetical protein